MSKRKPRRCRSLQLQSLEDRDLMTAASLIGGVLNIVGTEAADTITVGQVNGQIKVSGVSSSFSANSVRQINVDARGGNDTVDLRQVATIPCTVQGGAGNDRLFGGGAKDTLFGGAGDDLLVGGGGNDEIHGGAGNDRIEAGAGNDVLRGDAGNDLIFAGDGDDWADGGDGNDQLQGGAGADTLIGGAGVDALLGGQGVDWLAGDPAEIVQQTPEDYRLDPGQKTLIPTVTQAVNKTTGMDTLANVGRTQQVVANTDAAAKAAITDRARLGSGSPMVAAAAMRSAAPSSSFSSRLEAARAKVISILNQAISAIKTAYNTIRSVNAGVLSYIATVIRNQVNWARREVNRIIGNDSLLKQYLLPPCNQVLNQLEQFANQLDQYAKYLRRGLS